MYQLDSDDTNNIYRIARNVVAGILKCHFDSSGKSNHPDAQDLVQIILYKIVKNPQRLQIDSHGNPIKNVNKVIASIAVNACIDYLRTRNSNKFKLSNAIKDELRQNNTFFLEEITDSMICGFIKWKGDKRRLFRTPELNNLIVKPESILGEMKNKDFSSLNIAEQLSVIFNFVKCGIELDQLVAIISKVQGIEYSDSISYDDDENSYILNSKSTEINLQMDLENQHQLHHIWTLMRNRPLKHVAAFLLGSRYISQVDNCTLLYESGIAKEKELADALKMSLRRFNKIWKKLPLTHDEIGKLYNTTGKSIERVLARVREYLKEHGIGY
jgi:RNA polymerase sigma factor (sigma-70 family)